MEAGARRSGKAVFWVQTGQRKGGSRSGLIGGEVPSQVKVNILVSECQGSVAGQGKSKRQSPSVGSPKSKGSALEGREAWAVEETGHTPRRSWGFRQ